MSTSSAFSKLLKTAILLAVVWVVSLATVSQAQTWNAVPTKAGTSGTWQALSCSQTSAGTWQPIGCATATCPVGYTLSGSSCSITNTVAATPIYYCPNGGNLIGTSCNIAASSYAATGTTSTSQYSAAVTWVSRCPPTPATGPFQMCLGPNPMTGYLAPIRVPTTPSCPGGALSGVGPSSTCTMTTTSTTYSCPLGGNLSASTCTIPTSTYPASINSYLCSSGVVSGSSCLITTTIPATGG